MGQVGRDRAHLLHSLPQPSDPGGLDSRWVTTAPLLGGEEEGEVEEEGTWVMPAVRTGSRESRRSLQDWALAVEEEMR